MKFVICNSYTDSIFAEYYEKMAECEPTEYAEFRSGRVVNFNTAEELCKFLDRARFIFGRLAGSYEMTEVTVANTTWYDDDETKWRIIIDIINID